MKAYPNYKDSGVPWLKHVPEHWEIKPGLSMFKEKQVKNIGLIEKRVLSLSYGKIIIKPEEKLRGLVPESFETYQIVEPGDIIIRSTDMQNDHTSLRTGLVKDKGIITSAYICLNSLSNEFSNYNHWLLHGLDLMKVFYGLGSGLRQNLSWSDFKRLPLPLPTEDEQQQISRYLDWQTSKINKFIKAKKNLIALLKEQNQNIINEAVTKGTNPDVEMKDSGVEWLGQIPAHWDDRFFFQSFREKSIKNTGLVEKNRLSLSYGRIIRKSIDSAEGLLPMSFETYQIVERGDLILRLTDLQNDHKSLRVGLVQERGIITSAYLCLKTFPTIIPEYAYLLLHAYDLRKVFYSMGGGVRQSIGFSELKRLPFPVPTEEEQKAIIAKINSECKGIDLTIEKAEREIELIQEYRTRLVSDVVTGKVDVRSVEIPDFEPAPADLEAQDDEESEDELITEGIGDE